MLHSLLLVCPGMRAICRCVFRATPRLTDFISHWSIEICPDAQQHHCASKTQNQISSCSFFGHLELKFNIPPSIWDVHKMHMWPITVYAAQLKTRSLVLFNLSIIWIYWSYIKCGWNYNENNYALLIYSLFIQ